MPKKIALFYGHVASNIGDIAINQGQVRLLKAAFPEAAIQVVLRNAEKSDYLALARSSFGNDGAVFFSFLQTNNEKTLFYHAQPQQLLEESETGDCDLVVLAAGEHLFGYRNADNSQNLYWRTLPALAARVAGKPCLLLPSTFGPFEDDHARQLAANLLALIDGYAPRDSHSQRTVRALFDANAPAALLDPAFFLDPAPLPVVAPASGSKTLGLTMRSEGYGIRLAVEQRNARTAAFAEEGYRSSLALQFSVALGREWLQAGDHRLTLFVQTDMDRDLARHVQESLTAEGFGDKIRQIRPVSVEDYLVRLGEVDHVVASRFHAIILALMMHRPVFGLYFDVHGHKMPGLFELLAIPDACANLSTLTPEVAARAALQSILHTGPDWARVGETMARLRGETVAWLQGVVHKPVQHATTLQGFATLGHFALTIARNGFEIKTKLALQECEDTAAKKMQTLEAENEKKRQSLEAERQKQLKSLRQTLEEDQRKRIDTLRQGHDRALKAAIEAEKRRAAAAVQDAQARLQGHLSYRIGKILVDNGDKPSQWLFLPGKLYRAWQEFKEERGQLGRGGRKHGKIVMGKQDLFALYGSGGIAAVTDAINQTTTGATPKKRASEMLKFAKAFFDKGVDDAELPIVQAALDHERSEATVRALFWAANRANRLVTACEAIAELERILGPDPSGEQRALLRKMKGYPAYQLALLQKIPPRMPPVLTAQPQRLCYILHNSIPYSSGGYATRAHGVATGLHLAGYEVHLLTRPGFPLDTVPDLHADQVTLEETIDRLHYVRTLYPVRGKSPIADYIQQAAEALEERFREIKPALVMAASNYYTGLPALLAARRLGIPFIYEVRGFWEVTRLSREPEFVDSPAYQIQKEMEAGVAKAADHVFSLTTPMVRELMERGVPGDRVELLPNSCDPQRFLPRPRDEALARRWAIPPNVPVIGYIGTFVFYEGLEELASACALLKGRGLEFRLLLVGNENASGQERGPITEEITTIAATAGFADWLIMPGRVPHDQVEDYYSLIDIAPFPRKPLPVCEMVSPMKPLEALAMEKAVVYSSVQALADMLDNEKTGLMFEKGNTTSLADTIQRLLQEPALREQLGKNGRHWVETERTWRRVGEIASRVIRKLTQQTL